MGCSQYDELWKAIIRPPRTEYDMSEMGPVKFSINRKLYERQDLWVENDRGHKLAASYFCRRNQAKLGERSPCVIYLHGNCSTRAEALAVLPLLLPMGINVFCFDFSGSGMSEGDFVSLGYFERDDLASVVEYLEELDTVSTIGVWGRSMGATTALMHSGRAEGISGIVCDSAFMDLRIVAQELVGNCEIPIPSIILNFALWLVRSSILKRAKFDLDDVSPIKYVGDAQVPAVFIVADDDTFILPHHTRTLYEQYGGEKTMISCDGDHNSERPDDVDCYVAEFFKTVLFPQKKRPIAKTVVKYREENRSYVASLLDITTSMMHGVLYRLPPFRWVY